MSQSSISVAVRVRPFTAAEQNNLIAPAELYFGQGLLAELAPLPNGLRKVLSVVDERMLVFDPPETSAVGAMHKQAFGRSLRRSRDQRFVFDRLFDEAATQAEVFAETTQPLLASVLDGYNATVFAYGATGCGKTHTIVGTRDDPGVVYLTMQDLYGRLAARHTVLILFLEIYNEAIRDLLCPATPLAKLVLREDLRRMVVLNLLAHTPADLADVMRLIETGNANRTLLPTEANAALSRLHAVLQINVALAGLAADAGATETVLATLSIIDLAGSERAALTRNRGARLHEGANINRLLLALGNCINALGDARRRQHVPYRDSKLTRLLKFLLGGNCKTVMIVCVSPLLLHYDETLNTLKYADRAKEIRTKLVRNTRSVDRHVALYLRMITEQKLEIERLRARETTAVAQAADHWHTENDACARALLASIASMRQAVRRRPQVRKYLALAKRKLLLVQLQGLRTVEQAPGQALLRAAALTARFNADIESLEAQFREPGDMDDLLAQTYAHSHERLRQMPGWREPHSETYLAMFEQLKDHLQNDLLVLLSILFDYLVLALLDWTLGAAADPRRLDSLLADMHSGAYDAAIDAATDQFMRRFQTKNRARLPQQQSDRKRPARPPRDLDLSIDDSSARSDLDSDTSMLTADDLTEILGPDHLLSPPPRVPLLNTGASTKVGVYLE